LGAPQAIQVPDRWHLLKNLGDALKRFLDENNQELRLAAKYIAQAQRDQEQVDKPTPEQIKIAQESELDSTSPKEAQTLSK
jgi:hypothetical protein